MSFERPNLHFSVQRKQPALTANFGPLLAAAGERKGRGGLCLLDTKVTTRDTSREGTPAQLNRN